MKVPLKNLAWKNGNLFQHVNKLEEDLKKAQEEVEANPSNAEIKKGMSNILQMYNEAINDEEKLLAQKAKVKWLSEGDKNTKYFHNVVKRKRNLNIIVRIFDEHGNWFDGDKVPNQFVKHFEKFLSNNGDIDQIDSEGLFNKKLTKREADFMVRDVSDIEVKDVIFGIRDDKAPGPGGFTTTFFKKSWDIVRRDVCKAIKYFFKTNKLLGEVNTTLITLVPKIQHPSRVSEYRPIACCNVVYKCINNLLITQELLKGYNRKKGPQRCALKIDIAKAYDTVNCRFLENILGQFGFHEKLIGWVMTCVSSAAFSICVNGERDYKYVEVLKEGLMEFSKASSLIPNMNNNTIFFGSVKYYEIRKLLEVMPFTVGKLPMKYLGVPLITKNIGLQLISSVLDSMHIYWASVFLIPKTTIKEIEKALKGFLWCQGDLKRGAAKVAWKVICSPKSKGGLGIKSIGPWNEALLCKHLWNVIENKENLWVKWVNVFKLKGKSICEIKSDENDSGTWKAILSLRSKNRDSVWKKIGDGLSTNIWFDKWCKEGPLCDIILFKCRYEARLAENCKDVTDCVLWKDNNGVDGRFSIRKVWEKFKEDKDDVKWYKVVWFSQCNPRYAFILWLAMHKRLATQDRLMAWNKNSQLACPLLMYHKHILLILEVKVDILEGAITSTMMPSLVQFIPLWVMVLSESIEFFLRYKAMVSDMFSESPYRQLGLMRKMKVKDLHKSALDFQIEDGFIIMDQLRLQLVKEENLHGVNAKTCLQASEHSSRISCSKGGKCNKDSSESRLATRLRRTSRAVILVRNRQNVLMLLKEDMEVVDVKILLMSIKLSQWSRCSLKILESNQFQAMKSSLDKLDSRNTSSSSGSYTTQVWTADIRQYMTKSHLL
ncbi:RNA-directed DNA polymerase, eukaryota, reverse transcriptase zinc-binding domain protein [Tanacetum coccineum]